MNTDRELMQQALEALEQVAGAMPFPVALQVRAALRERLAQPVQEPVAFLAGASRFKVTLTQSDCKITNLPRELGGRWVALVAAENDCHMKLTAPQPRRPLTEERLEEMFGKGVNAKVFREVARLIEAEHGIKE